MEMASAPEQVSFEPAPANCWGTIRLDYPKMRSGVHYCEFVADEFIDKYLDNSWKLVIGVVSESSNFTEEGQYIGSDDKSFGYVAQSGNKIGQSTETQYDKPFKSGNRIGVLVDFNRDEISFFRDGVNLGPAFKGFLSKLNSKPDGHTFYFGVSMVRAENQPPEVPGNKRIRHKSLVASEVLHGGELKQLNGDNSNSPLSNLVAALHPQGSENEHLMEVDTSITFESKTSVTKKEISYLRFDDFPRDIKQVILSFLSMPDLKRARAVCQEWRRLSDSDFIWGPLVQTVIPAAPTMRLLENGCLPYKEVYRNNIMKFDSEKIGPGIAISNDGHTITSTETVNFWAAARLQYPRMQSGVHYCEFRVDTYRHGSIGNTWKIVIGILSDAFDFSLTKWVGVDEMSFGYIAQNGKKVGPSCKNQGEEYGQTYQDNDVIGVLFDATKKKIKFFKNGVSQGYAFTDPAEFEKTKGQNFYFGVSLARFGMAVTALRYECLGEDFDIDTFEPAMLNSGF